MGATHGYCRIINPDPEGVPQEMDDPSRVRITFLILPSTVGLAPTAIVVSSLQDEDRLILNEYFFNAYGGPGMGAIAGKNQRDAISRPQLKA